MNVHYNAVVQRANYRCEYCKAPELVFNFPFEVEHIIPVSLGGTNELSNLALACRSCNLRKGMKTDGKEIDSGEVVRFFHPRKDFWNEHFQVDVNSANIQCTTTIGAVTIEALKMNSSTQVNARKLWIQLDLFP